MLLKFRFENFRSFSEEQVLSFAATKDSPEDPRLLHVEAVATAILPAIAIYGANASGKTNAIRALSFMAQAVRASHRLWEPHSGVPLEPFALDGVADARSLFEVEVVAEHVRYRYGFVVSAERVLEEWLYAWPNGHQQTWFEREDARFKFGRHFSGDNEAIARLTRDNSLFLSAAAQHNHPLLAALFAWFAGIRFDLRSSRATLSRSASLELDTLFSAQTTLFEERPSSIDREAILTLVRAADTGIVDVKVTRGDPHERAAPRIEFQHKSASPKGGWLPLEDESAGTRALVELSLQLRRGLRLGGLVAIDELEASLHPMLALAVIRLFHDPKLNPGKGQLLFTTHDTNLLGSLLGETPLRRDQVWFTEKDQIGRSHLYPLTDFHPRKEENLERGYLQGRYGAVPFLSDLVPAKET
jgi:hypothetical protein